MKVHFRTYCQGCRYGKRWQGKCLWPQHRFDWDYYIECNGKRLVQRQCFRTKERAWKSAERSWKKLLATECIKTEQEHTSRGSG